MFEQVHIFSVRAETVPGIRIRQCGQLTIGGFSANTIGAFIYFMESRNGGLHIIILKSCFLKLKYRFGLVVLLLGLLVEDLLLADHLALLLLHVVGPKVLHH